MFGFYYCLFIIHPRRRLLYSRHRQRERLYCLRIRTSLLFFRRLIIRLLNHGSQPFVYRSFPISHIAGSIDFRFYLAAVIDGKSVENICAAMPVDLIYSNLTVRRICPDGFYPTDIRPNPLGNIVAYGFRIATPRIINDRFLFSFYFCFALLRIRAKRDSENAIIKRTRLFTIFFLVSSILFIVRPLLLSVGFLR